jgi:predicted nucleic acid-binding Zn ribbon protein
MPMPTRAAIVTESGVINAVCTCGAEFAPARKGQKYCSSRCRFEAFKVRQGREERARIIVRRIGELNAELTEKGFHRFNCGCEVCNG